MKQVFVIDPGMMEAGGHHAALISTLASYDDVGKQNITLVTHKQLAGSLLTQAEEQGISVIKHFDSNFYENYDSAFSLKSASSQRYIRMLASEYLSCFNAVVTDQKTYSTITFFYPCLNWDHAFALNLALTRCQQQGTLDGAQHKVCCMFMPGDRDDHIKSLSYKQAFTALSVIDGVSLFASDFETKQFYEELSVLVQGIHPCYLLPWGQISTTHTPKGGIPTFLLYLGDAKENKGFNTLPNLIEKLLKQYNNNVILIVQYTLAWDYPELKKSICALDELSAKHQQVKLYTEYWSTASLVKQLKSVNAIYCTYSVDEYQYKSSGLAWLAVFFNIPVVLNGDCWLSREFDRLAHDYNYIYHKREKWVPKCPDEKAPGYFRSLFGNLIHWF
ncbi:hypothetical protein MHM87_18510 [Alteromonas sp. Cnat3-28]|uniref:hypothetical protein n=1 Tax=Alteromonas sp. Cnat3-28 TaxID=2917729 RepID=UPI001EF5ED53|nr:hypothetical protein [Alteromonas sp. Cnat3-28]MCG7647567.1 hypothetical protein [Alteromonas sp. Cnat3-28]